MRNHKKRNRVLSFLLAFAMIIGMTSNYSTSVFAADASDSTYETEQLAGAADASLESEDGQSQVNDQSTGDDQDVADDQSADEGENLESATEGEGSQTATNLGGGGR